MVPVDVCLEKALPDSQGAVFYDKQDQVRMLDICEAVCKNFQTTSFNSHQVKGIRLKSYEPDCDDIRRPGRGHFRCPVCLEITGFLQRSAE
jgi:hypothetical protein